jgi:hypothetical protein
MRAAAYSEGEILRDTVNRKLGSFLLKFVPVADPVGNFPNVFEISQPWLHNTHCQFADYAFQFLIGLGYGRHLVRLTHCLDAAMSEMLQLYLDALALLSERIVLPHLAILRELRG